MLAERRAAALVKRGVRIETFVRAIVRVVKSSGCAARAGNSGTRRFAVGTAAGGPRASAGVWRRSGGQKGQGWRMTRRGGIKSPAQWIRKRRWRRGGGRRRGVSTRGRALGERARGREACECRECCAPCSRSCTDSITYTHGFTPPPAPLADDAGGASAGVGGMRVAASAAGLLAVKTVCTMPI